MGCLSHRKKQTQEFADQKWDYINLQDFKAKGCGMHFAYGYLWFMLLLSVAFYAVDTFTAVNLLFYNRRVTAVEPAIDPDISKWIFSVCVILSFVNLGYEGIRAWRVMKRGNVAESYLDSLAVRWESIRLGSGQGWRRFLVFAELTKSKKGAEYIALFTYFSFQSWIRVLICSGPRQVVNVFTLRSVYDARFAIQNSSVEGSISEFFQKIGIIADEDYRLAVTLCGMLFTLVIWAFSLLFLLAAVLFYVFFLFHWIPRADGGLSGYCERKITKALLRIVTEKVNKALAKGQTDRANAELQAAKKNGEPPALVRAATIPTLPNVQLVKEDSLPAMPTLARSETMTTLPAYTSRPATPPGFELIDQKRPTLPHQNTVASDASYASNAPLVGAAADMGYGRPASPGPARPRPNPGAFAPPRRPDTSNSQRSYGPRPGFNHQYTDSNSGSSLRSPVSEYGGSAFSGSAFTVSAYSNAMPPYPPGPVRSETMRSMDSHNQSMAPFPGPARSETMRTMDSHNQPMPRDNFARPSPAPRQYEAYNPEGRSSPAPTMNSYGGGPTPMPRQPGGMNRPPFQPTRSATGPLPPRGPTRPPQRNLTGPSADYFDQSHDQPSRAMRGPPDWNGPAPGRDQRGSPYGYDVESQQDRGYY